MLVQLKHPLRFTSPVDKQMFVNLAPGTAVQVVGNDHGMFTLCYQGLYAQIACFLVRLLRRD